VVWVQFNLCWKILWCWEFISIASIRDRIWCNRNEFFFKVYYLAEDLKRAKEEEFVNVVGVTDVSFVPIPKWSAPDMGMEINCGFVVMQLSESAGAGGLAHDNNHNR